MQREAADDGGRRPRSRGRGGRVPRPAGAERLREDDHAPLHRRARDGRGGCIPFGDRCRLGRGAQRINVPPNKRDIGMVFQSYALWPHMTVRENIGYPLQTAETSATGPAEWIESGGARRHAATPRPHPAQLSGGQQQRIALARGIVARRAACCSTSPEQTSTRGCVTRARPRSTSCTAARLHGGLRDARPGRGARPGRQARNHAPRRARAARVAG